MKCYITVKLPNDKITSYYRVGTIVTDYERDARKAAKTLRLESIKHGEYVGFKPSELSWAVYQNFMDKTPCLYSANWKD